MRVATLDFRVSEKLQNLIVQRDNYIERTGQEWANVQNALDALKNTVETIFNMTQRIESIEEMLLDVQASIESMKNQQNKETP